jgi:nitrate reductase gamma subunit
MLSNFDDYFSWFVTITPIATGMLAYAHYGAPYPTLLGLHLLSVELLMLWFPFGKLMHAFTMFIARGVQGVAFERKGASL